MKQYIFILLFTAPLHLSAGPVVKTDTFSFLFEGKKRTGLLDQPIDKKPVGLIILVPGSGSTNMIQNGWYYRSIRSFFVGEGFACYVWDKGGCGMSEGVFNGDVSVQESAREAVVAIEELKRLHIPGSERIGLWGLSRGGWVCPQIIKDYPSVAFWISVSGPDAEESFGYLLERNFLIEGRSEEETKRLIKAWYSNLDIARHGGSFEENQKATEMLRNDSFYMFICQGSPKPTKEAYLKWQKSLMNGENLPVNEKTGLQIYFPELDTILCNINCPVLAIFGEKDSQVPWERAITLYQHTMGKNPDTILTIKTFPDANHNMFRCKTGGYREKLDTVEFCDGYFEVMAAWLKELDEKKSENNANR